MAETILSLVVLPKLVWPLIVLALPLAVLVYPLAGLVCPLVVS